MDFHCGIARVRCTISQNDSFRYMMGGFEHQVSLRGITKLTYASGETPNVGDRITDNRGRVGTVTAASDGGIFTVSWEDGVVGVNYTISERFTLISGASETSGN
jgi:hypothetical protein